MHLRYRSKTHILLSMIALLGIVGAMLVAVVTSRTTYAAAASSQLHGNPSTATRLSTSRPSLTDPTNAGGKRMIPDHIPAHTINAVMIASMGGVSSTSLSKTQGSLLHNFNGLSDVDQAAVNGGTGVGELTPPDQGLCVGFDPGVPGTKVVFQTINSALRETSVNNGTLPGDPLLGNKDVSFANFWEPNAFSDPRCFFDPSTSTSILMIRVCNRYSSSMGTCGQRSRLLSASRTTRWLVMVSPGSILTRHQAVSRPRATSRHRAIT